MLLLRASLLCLLFLVVHVSARIPPRFLRPFVPTITMNFLTALSPSDNRAIDRANEDFRRLRQGGQILTDVEQSQLVKRYSNIAYLKIVGFEEAITRQFLTMPLRVQRLMDEILENKTSLDFTELEEPMNEYVILVSDLFKTLTRDEEAALIKAFPNYRLLFRDSAFIRISTRGVDQIQAAEQFITKLLGRRRLQ
ncbi:hypothetical protein L596_025055 [Steinernema carpocapsae]|uniref:Uncharacterized protein n=1 Tax=Steinernema carpocapsae TaxID=34508 RepID=A0A4U5M7I2_STECR|nr:hypothetical protein L596_025055 [Steinernema carpocapsae]